MDFVVVIDSDYLFKKATAIELIVESRGKIGRE